MPANVYNPRERSFIQPPEIKTCPTCGQLMQPEIKPMNNHMNNYISETGVILTINSDKDILVIKDVPMYKCDEQDSKTGLFHRSSGLRNALAEKQAAQIPAQQVVQEPSSKPLTAKLPTIILPTPNSNL